LGRPDLPSGIGFSGPVVIVPMLFGHKFLCHVVSSDGIKSNGVAILRSD
jgi:hypothetical protein